MNPKLLLWLSHVVFITVIAVLSMNNLLDWPVLLLIFAMKLEAAVIAHYVLYNQPNKHV